MTFKSWALLVVVAHLLIHLVPPLAVLDLAAHFMIALPFVARRRRAHRAG